MRKIAFIALTMFFIFSYSVNADTVSLEYDFPNMAKLGEETSYTFFVDDSGEYEFFVSYNKEYLQLVSTDHGGDYFGICAPNYTDIKDANGKITIHHPRNACNGPVTLTFKTLKEGITDLKIEQGRNTSFSANGAPQEFDDIRTEIINTNIEPVECEPCAECENSNSISDTMMYIMFGFSLIALLLAMILFISSSRNRKSTIQ